MVFVVEMLVGRNVIFRKRGFCRLVSVFTRFFLWCRVRCCLWCRESLVFLFFCLGISFFWKFCFCFSICIIFKYKGKIYYNLFFEFEFFWFLGFIKKAGFFFGSVVSDWNGFYLAVGFFLFFMFLLIY